MRLAKEVAHTVDVDGMLACMTPQQFDEWIAAYKLWASEVQPEPPKTNALQAMRKLTGV